MQYVDVSVRLDAAAARDRAAQELESRKFRVTWENEWYGVAERGNKALSLVVGVFAQYFKVGIRVMASQGDVTVVRFEKLASGWMSGWLGALRADKQIKDLRDDFARAFDSVGLLAGVAQG
jgi:hypothetical protein